MRILLVAAVALGVLAAPSVQAQERAGAAAPVVVELYTSQGCAFCPPADEILHQLAARDDVIALALHVDYWDYIGWVDAFGRPEHTARQQAYARVAGAKTVYTPQMVIGGTDLVIGSRVMDVMDRLQAHAARPAGFDLALTRAGDQVIIRAGIGPQGQYDVQLVRYMPQAAVEIRGGENAGQVLTYTNIVTQWDVLGQWDGTSALHLTAAASGADPVAVIIQRSGQGAIMAAAALR